MYRTTIVFSKIWCVHGKTAPVKLSKTLWGYCQRNATPPSNMKRSPLAFSALVVWHWLGGVWCLAAIVEIWEVQAISPPSSWPRPKLTRLKQSHSSLSQRHHCPLSKDETPVLARSHLITYQQTTTSPAPGPRSSYIDFSNAKVFIWPLLLSTL